MRAMMKYVLAFCAIIFVGFGVAWLFSTYILDPKAERESARANPQTGLARTVQMNKLLQENAYPNLNGIIKANKGNVQKMQEEISIAYRALPMMEVIPSHGAVVENNTDGSVAGILVVDTTNTPGIYTLVTLTGHDFDKFGNPLRIMRMMEGGRILEIPVPKGSFNISFASGGAWFGTHELFGPLTDRLAFDGSYPFNEKHPGYQLTTFPKEGADFQIGAVRLKAIPRHDRMVQDKIELLKTNDTSKQEP